MKIEKIDENRLDYLSECVNPLLQWYDKGHRELPWRTKVSGYRVWVSEIMLQQTRVEAVKPYFARFMDTFTDIETLSKADDEVLLKYWEGLGYYSRVRNMKKAAIQIIEEYDGKMPEDYEKLIKLPGIGSYTAGAIASIAYGKQVPAVDGNVLRIFSRLRMDDRKITDASTKKQIERELTDIMPVDRSGDLNQAMMELGATVCVPNGAPKCEECPWQQICQAHLHSCELEYPKKDSKKKRVIEEKTVLIIKDDQRIAIHKRPDKGLLAGMYELPMLDGKLKEKEVIKRLKDSGLSIIRIQPLPEAKHIFTHKEWHMIGYAIRVDELEKRDPKSLSITDWLYILPEDTKDKYPIPSAFSAFTDYVHMKLGNDRFE